MSREGDGGLNRYPVLISQDVIALLTVYEGTTSFADLWTVDLERDPTETRKRAAKELLNPILQHCSVNMLWALRETLAEEIEYHNREFGCSFPLDRPNEP